MFEEIQAIIAEKLDMDKAEITPTATFEDLNIDSLDMVEIVCDLEEKYNVNFEKNDQPTDIPQLLKQIEALVK